MNFLLTGTPGSGKIALVNYADRLGDKRFFDTDSVVGLCEWREFETGNVLGPVEKYKEAEKIGGNAWYKKYGWYWREDFLKKFLADNPNSVICGSSENIADCYKYFDKIFILKKTDVELFSNLQSPERVNPFGKTPEQRKNFLNWQDYLIREAQKYNPILVEGNFTANTYKFLLQSIK